MFKILLSSISFIIITISPVVASNISPLDTANFAERKILAKNLKKRNKTISKILFDDYTNSELNYVKPIYQSFDKGLNEDVLKGDYIFHPGFDSIINMTHSRLIAANPFLKKNCLYFVSRDISLNAMSTVYNTYIINLGALCFLTNRDEFAAIIAHEHAHNYLKHQVTSLKNAYQIDKNEAKKSVKDIKKNKYDRGTKAMTKYKSILYSKGIINRKHEFEADSLGYLLYKNAGYRPDLYLNAFRLMMEYDTVKTENLDILIYQKIFDLPNQTFKQEWLKQEDFSGYDYSKYKIEFHPDSVRSHPEYDERIENLKRLYPELTVETTDSVEADNEYSRMQHTAFYEVFQSLDISEDYGFGVYGCLIQLADSTSNTEEEIKYYKQWLGKYFTKIHKARKEYTLNRYLDKVDPKKQSKDYQQFLNFMWNLKVTELEQIAKYYSN